jgi:hypothetical protein
MSATWFGTRSSYPPGGLLNPRRPPRTNVPLPSQERRRSHLFGTRRLSSASKCCTTMIWGGAAVWSEPPPSLIMRNRWPSGEMSYVRPVLPPGIVE